MDSSDMMFWNLFLPPFAMGFSLYGIVTFTIIALKFKSEHYGIIVIMSISIFLFTFFDTLSEFFPQKFIFDWIEVLFLLPMIWTIPALISHVLPIETKIHKASVKITQFSIPLITILIIISFISPDALMSHGRKIGLVLYVYAGIITVESTALIVVYFRYLTKYRENLLILRPYVIAPFAMLPFGIGQILLTHMDSNIFPLSVVEFPLMTGGFLVYSVIVGRGTLRHAAHEAKDASTHRDALHKELFYDSLTGLPNRRFFHKRLKEMTSEEDDDTAMKSMAVIFLGLDYFRSFNDIYGYLAGDELLKETGKRMKRILGDANELYRVGSSEFAALLIGEKENRARAVTADKLVSAFREPVVTFLDEPVFITASAGVASIGSQDGCSAKELKRNANSALQQAKKRRNTYVMFSLRMEEESVERVSMIQIVKQALVGEMFKVYYQPIVNQNGVMVGAEALARLEIGGQNYPPGKFIPVAETTGLIKSVGEQVMRTVLDDRVSTKEFPEDFHISINLSVKQLLGTFSVKKIDDAVQLRGLKPKQIHLEITESSLIENLQEVLPTVQVLRDLGYKISLDDFGTGYSSLGYLLNLPIDTLKLDRQFLLDMDENEFEAKAMFNSLFMMARGINLKVIVEGVETAMHRNYLDSYENIFQQGYTHGKPMPIENLVNCIKND